MYKNATIQKLKERKENFQAHSEELIDSKMQNKNQAEVLNLVAFMELHLGAQKVDIKICTQKNLGIQRLVGLMSNNSDDRRASRV